MAVLGILLISWLIFRVAGALGVRALASWKASGRWALAVMLLFTASAHFTATRHDLARMVPEALPYPMAIIYATGVLEAALALGILLPRTRKYAGVALVVLLVAMFPANVRAAMEGLELRGNPATPLWLRAPMQLLFIGLAWWTTRD